MRQLCKSTHLLLSVFISIVLFFPFIHSTHAAERTSIVIKRAEHTLYYKENGRTVKTFPITTGQKSTPTPAGTFTIVYKERNRPFYKKQIAGGAPNNPLGTRWLGLNIGGTKGNTYGIHGTNQAGTIGLKISDGCIRMKNADVEWLYDRVDTGTPVIIE
ncbi:L,D-transpeptidase [Bacillus thuringiensis]